MHYHTFGTQTLFPLLKDSMYASYNISIKHHENYTALSNMPMWEVIWVKIICNGHASKLHL